MNKARRKWLEDIIGKLEEQKMEIESVRDEEQEMLDCMPESLHESERGQTMSENIDELDSAASDLDDIISSLQEIVDK
ncbi:MAG: hypothetical protein IKP36_04975 [Bacteroidaceae bacterium]|nr:hypothetical protein [Bacteroidaceae bacterium]